MNMVDTFCECVQERIHCTKDDARKIYDYYVQEKILHIDRMSASASVSNGVFWDPQVLRKALIKAQSKAK